LTGAEAFLYPASGFVPALAASLQIGGLPTWSKRRLSIRSAPGLARLCCRVDHGRWAGV